MHIRDREIRIDLEFEKVRASVWGIVYRSTEYDKIFSISQATTNPILDCVSYSVLGNIHTRIQLNYGFEW